MTTSTATEVQRRAQRQQRERAYFADSLARQIREDQMYATRTRFPSPLYRDRPLQFFREVLGVEPWERQREIIEAIRVHDRVAVSSGHKCGKSAVAAGIALWFYCSFQDARVVMTSTTSRQVDQILWRELRMQRARSGRCVECKAADPEGLRIPRPCPHSAVIDGEQGELARTGLKSADFREVVGFTAREAEAVAGISGRNLLYIVDEASGVDDEIFQAIEGNRAGGARLLMLSNPTRNRGEFYEAFTSKKQFYCTLRMSSEETPNVLAGELVIPGLATSEWIREKKEEWGQDSVLYKVRVRGEHAIAEEDRLFNLHMIEEAEQRWAVTPEAGRLFVGLDPAGETGRGDETCFAVRRGLKLLALHPYRALDEDRHLALLLQLLDDYKLPRELPVVVLDREGPVGSSVYRRLRDHLADRPHAFELHAVKASAGAQRRPNEYDRLRDELCANLRAWFRDGGAIVEDAKLANELHCMEWRDATKGRFKLIEKRDIRKVLGRSPDRYDALALACWEAASLRDQLPRAEAAAEPDDHAHERVFDPYAASDAWQRR